MIGRFTLFQYFLSTRRGGWPINTCNKGLDCHGLGCPSACGIKGAPDLNAIPSLPIKLISPLHASMAAFNASWSVLLNGANGPRAFSGNGCPGRGERLKPPISEAIASCNSFQTSRKPDLSVFKPTKPPFT